MLVQYQYCQMIKKIFSPTLLTWHKKIFTPFQIVSNRAYSLTNKSRMVFSDSKPPTPRNKQQAWMMQQQERMKQQADDDQLKKASYEGVTKVGVAGFAALAGALIYFFYYASQTSSENVDSVDKDISGFKELKQKQSLIGGDWTLVGTEGQPISSKSLYGYYYLIYFGYTNCPDICPSTLYYLSSVYRIVRNLPQGAYLKLKIVFVSVDPERDSPKVMKQYLKQFGKQIVGVTSNPGDKIQINQCMKKFKIKASKIFYEDGPKKGEYEIDHTTRVYLMDSNNIYLDHLNPKLTEQQTAKVIVAKIVESEHRKDKAQKQLIS